MANSLKARAIALLAGREHSRIELRRKLLRRLASAAAIDHDAERGPAGRGPVDGSDAAGADPKGGDADDSASRAREVDALLDWLESHDYLSPARFVESRVHARAARHGAERIRQELGRHAVEMPADVLLALRASEFDRARAVWQRKFGEPAPDAAGRARQARFLAGRGFTAQVIGRIVRGLEDPD